MSTKKANPRTTEGLRNVLFDEIDELRGNNADPGKSMAVANIAKQIINTAKVELEFSRVMHSLAEDGHHVKLGNLQLGSE